MTVQILRNGFAEEWGKALFPAGANVRSSHKSEASDTAGRIQPEQNLNSGFVV